MEQDLQARALGLYIHIPWCLTRCPYCNFYALPYSKAAFEDYYALILMHKALVLPMLDQPLTSVYFGGGTPSLLSSEMITEIIEDLPLADDAEITLEVNPIQITSPWVAKLHKSPINRLSLGIQSMFDDELIYLGRKHHAKEIPEKLRILIDSGFENISGDLIYGLPHSSVDTLKKNLDKFLSLPLTHLSCYLLELDQEGKLAADRKLLPEDEKLEAQYKLIRHTLNDAGYRQYEISNFALPGRESRHNILYWKGDDFLALGASASGYFRGIRYQNPPDLSAYRLQVNSGKALGDEDPAQNEEADYIMMRLRLTAGLNLREFRARFGKDFFANREDHLRRMMQLGFLLKEGDILRLSSKALFISNAVIGEIL